MGTSTFHGVRVAWETRGLSPATSEAVERAFAGLGAAWDRADGAADLAIAIARSKADLAGAPEGFRQVFFQGNVRGFARGGEIRLVAPAAQVTIAADGRRIDALVDAESVNAHGLTNTTLVIALAIALRHRGMFHLHGGALVRADGRRVLVMGDSGAGKSTVTLALLGDGSLHLGDDTLFVAERAGRPRLLAFARPFHLGPATAAAFPALPITARDANGKSHVDASALPGRAAESMEAPHFVLFPQVTREAVTRVVALDAADAFGQVLRSSAMVAVDGMSQAAEQLRLLQGLVREARAFELHLGADWLTCAHEVAERIPWGA